MVPYRGNVAGSLAAVNDPEIELCRRRQEASRGKICIMCLLPRQSGLLRVLQRRESGRIEEDKLLGSS